MSTNTYVRYVRRIGFLFDTLELKPEYKITPRVERKRKKIKFYSPAEVIQELLRLGDEKKKPECGLERSLEITQRMNYLSKALMLDSEYMTERRRKRLPKSRFHHERTFNLKKKKGKRKKT